MKTTTTRTILAAGIFAILSAPAFGTLLYSEDFEGGTPGDAANTLNGPTGNWGGSASGNAAQASIDNTSTAFGVGNQYLSMTRSSNNFNFLNNTAPIPDIGVGTPVTLSFDIYASTNSFPTYLRVLFRGASDSTTQNTRYIDVGTGTANVIGSELGVDWHSETVAHFDIVAELTTAGTLGVTNSAAGVVDIFVNGVQTANDLPMNFPGNSNIGDLTNINSFGLWHHSDNTGSSVLIDNIEVRDVAYVIPEPSSLLLLGIGAAGILASRRKR